MTDIDRYVEHLKSPINTNRYEACEELRVLRDLPEKAVLALQETTNDPDPLVADAARRALEPKLKQSHKTNKARDLIIGFFAWFLVGNLTFLISWLFNKNLGELTPVVIVTIIMMGTLFYKNKNWFAYGIVAALITNSLFWSLIFSLRNIDSFFTVLMWGVSRPIPLGFPGF